MWTAAGTPQNPKWTNADYPGTITGVMIQPGLNWGAPTGSWNVPQLTTQIFNTEFLANPGVCPKPFVVKGSCTGVGSGIVFTFSPGYAWGTGGVLILGNVHNWFSYTLSAWDAGNIPIDVTNWKPPPGFLPEYPDLGSATSSTTVAPSGTSLIFSVRDPGHSAVSGQGGVLPLLMTQGTNTPADRVAKIRLTLSNVDYTKFSSNPGADFILFNVASTAQACPKLEFKFLTRTNGTTANVLIGLKNKGPGNANVLVSGIVGNLPFKFTPQSTAVTPPFWVPGANPLPPFMVTAFKASFTRPGPNQSGPFSAVVSWVGPNGICPGHQVFYIP